MLGKLGLDLGANNIGAFLMHQDLDARLGICYRAALRDYRCGEWHRCSEKIGFRQEVADLCATMGVRPRPPPT